MGQYCLNSAKNIVYVDCNGNQRIVKEVWYCSKNGMIQVYPRSIYYKDVKIVDLSASGAEYNLSWSNNNPVYTHGGQSYNGIGPGNYAVKATIVIDKGDTYEEYQNCYLSVKAIDDSYGGWIYKDNHDFGYTDKLNPIINEDQDFSVIVCSSDSYTNDSNVYFLPFFMYQTGKLDDTSGDTPGYATIQKPSGESRDIMLKRAQRKSQLTWSAQTSHPTMRNGDTVTYATKCYHFYWWDAPNRGSSKSGVYVTYSDNVNGLINVTVNNGTVSVACVKDVSSQINGSFYIQANSNDPWPTPSNTLTGSVTLVPEYEYRVTVNNQTIGVGATSISLTKEESVILTRSRDVYTSTNPTWETVESFTLRSSSPAVSVNGTKIKPNSNGEAIIKVLVYDVEVTEFPVIANIEDTPTYMVANVGTLSSIFKFPDTNILTITRNHVLNYPDTNSYVTLTIAFKTAESNGMDKTLYVTKESGDAYSISAGSLSSASVTFIDKTSKIIKLGIYKSQDGEKLGTLTINYL